ncbi:MAG: hypothetical protein ACRELB_24595, partial [Polyangiaceae bacterium]
MNTEIAAKMIGWAADMQRLATLMTTTAAQYVATQGSIAAAGSAETVAVAPAEGTQGERLLGYLRQL